MSAQYIGDFVESYESDQQLKEYAVNLLSRFLEQYSGRVGILGEEQFHMLATRLRHNGSSLSPSREETIIREWYLDIYDGSGIAVGQTWEGKESSNRYVIVCLGRLRVENRHVDSVNFRTVEATVSPKVLYTRSMTDFLSNFKLVVK